jgi:hypothetical protein
MPLSGRLLTEKMALPLLPARIATAVLGGFGLLAMVAGRIPRDRRPGKEEQKIWAGKDIPETAQRRIVKSK